MCSAPTVGIRADANSPFGFHFVHSKTVTYLAGIGSLFIVGEERREVAASKWIGTHNQTEMFIKFKQKNWNSNETLLRRITGGTMR